MRQTFVHEHKNGQDCRYKPLCMKSSVLNYSWDGDLQYAICTFPDIMYVINNLSIQHKCLNKWATDVDLYNLFIILT